MWKTFHASFLFCGSWDTFYFVEPFILEKNCARVHIYFMSLTFTLDQFNVRLTNKVNTSLMVLLNSTGSVSTYKYEAAQQFSTLMIIINVAKLGELKF